GALVKHSLLFSNVHVRSYSHVEDRVVLPDVEIGEHCRLRRVVVDKGCRIPDNTVIGYDREQDARRFYISENGVIVVTPEMLGQDYHRVH
ncbi:MAG: glucose-1-phosphate adenylyltransferase, partial [Chromatiales bacterium]|nr:glucose-1-phosphate adenylyltransferase [Chromatiales bacterium]